MHAQLRMYTFLEILAILKKKLSSDNKKKKII